MLNKFGPSGHGEAQVQYLDGDFRVISPGTYVRCAVTDARIPLDELKYWSVDLQEAYAIPTAVLQRHFPAAVKTQRLALLGAKFLLARLEQPIAHELPQLRGVVEFERDRERHDIASPVRKSLRRCAAAPDPFPSSPASARRACASAIRRSISAFENGW